MKKLLTTLCIAAALLLGSLQAQAVGGFRFGIKAGMSVNSMKFNEKVFESSNREGFTGGIMLQWLPSVLPVGFDVSAMYVHRSSRIYCFAPGQNIPMGDDYSVRNVGRNYFEIPVNLKWVIAPPLIGQFVKPFFTTGPDFSFLLSKTHDGDYWRNRSFDLAWNFGFGLQIVNKVQLAASYGVGLKNSGSGNEALYGKNAVDGKNRFWTLTAAWLF